MDDLSKLNQTGLKKFTKINGYVYSEGFYLFEKKSIKLKNMAFLYFVQQNFFNQWIKNIASLKLLNEKESFKQSMNK